MIETYSKYNNRLVKDQNSIPLDQVLWTDIINMTDQEEIELESKFSLDLPNQREVALLEISNRFYKKNGAVYITFTLTSVEDNKFSNYLVTFVSFKKSLLTVRFIENFSSFERITAALTKDLHLFSSHTSIFIEILYLIIRDISEKINLIGHSIDKINDMLFLKSDKSDNKKNYLAILQELGNQVNSISKSQESLLSIKMGINFLLKNTNFDDSNLDKSRLKVVLSDVNAINDYTHSLDSEASFLLNASLGMINIEQNNLAKSISVISIIFLPATLIASIYGMNFDFMPELKFKLGYPFALLLIFLSMLISYKICRKNKWTK